MQVEYKGKIVFLTKDEIAYLDSQQKLIHHSSGKITYNDMEVYSTEKARLSITNNFLGE
jgi:hypothetical protein